MDIVSLAALFLHISGSFEQLSGEAGMHPIDYFSIGQIYQDLEMNDLAEKILVDCIEKKSLPKEMSIDALKRVAAINKRNENHENALQFWQKASKQGDIDSSIEIAKYYEHYVRDYVIALRWAEIAGSTLAERGYHNYQDRQNRKEIDKRITRLKQKLEKGIKHVPTKDS
jgi:TPR repeat protein